MSIENLKDLDDVPIGKLIIMISRGHSFYLNHKLEKIGINSSQLHYLFEISRQNELNQNEIASRCNIDKGAVARSIKKLEDLNLITRQIDENNRRQNKISITKDGQKIVDETRDFLDKWENVVLADIDNKDELRANLTEIVIKTIEFNKGELKANVTNKK